MDWEEGNSTLSLDFEIPAQDPVVRPSTEWKFLWLFFAIVNIPGLIIVSTYSVLVLVGLKTERLPVRRYGVILNVSLAELLLASSGTIINFMFYNFKEYNPRMMFLCGLPLLTAYNGIFFFYSFLSILQLIAVRFPLWYQVKFTERVCFFSCAGIWLFSFLGASPILLPVFYDHENATVLEAFRASLKEKAKVGNGAYNFKGTTNFILVVLLLACYLLCYLSTFPPSTSKCASFLFVTGSSIRSSSHNGILHRRKVVQKLGCHIFLLLIGNSVIIAGFFWQLGGGKFFKFYEALGYRNFEFPGNQSPLAGRLLAIGYLIFTFVTMFLDPMLHVILEPRLLLLLQRKPPRRDIELSGTDGFQTRKRSAGKAPTEVTSVLLTDNDTDRTRTQSEGSIWH